MPCWLCSVTCHTALFLLFMSVRNPTSHQLSLHFLSILHNWRTPLYCLSRLRWVAQTRRDETLSSMGILREGIPCASIHFTDASKETRWTDFGDFVIKKWVMSCIYYAWIKLLSKQNRPFHTVSQLQLFHLRSLLYDGVKNLGYTV